MRLIAETTEENALLPGLVALLADLGVETSEYRTDEAYAMAFWSASDLSHFYAEQIDLTHEEAQYLLEEIEPFLRATMVAAGAKLIDKMLYRNLNQAKKLAYDPFCDR